MRLLLGASAALGSWSIPGPVWLLRCVTEVEHALQSLSLEDGHWGTSLPAPRLPLCTKPVGGSCLGDL